MPGSILVYAQQFGEFSAVKIDNMAEQHGEMTKKEDPSDSNETREYAIVSVAVGNGVEQMFRELNVTELGFPAVRP